MTPDLGDFVCVPMHGTSGELIRVGQWLCGDGFHNYEHAEVYVENPGGEVKPVVGGYTMGAYPGGAALEPLAPVSYQQGWLWSTGIIQLTDTQRCTIANVAISLKGIPYSALDYFAIAGHRLHIPDPDGELQKYIASTKHMICSQLVDYCYMMAGVHLFSDGRWPGFVTPGDLANVLLHPESIKLGKPGIDDYARV